MEGGVGVNVTDQRSDSKAGAHLIPFHTLPAPTPPIDPEDAIVAAALAYLKASTDQDQHAMGWLLAGSDPVTLLNAMTGILAGYLAAEEAQGRHPSPLGQPPRDLGSHPPARFLRRGGA